MTDHALSYLTVLSKAYRSVSWFQLTKCLRSLREGMMEAQRLVMLVLSMATEVDVPL